MSLPVWSHVLSRGSLSRGRGLSPQGDVSVQREGASVARGFLFTEGSLSRGECLFRGWSLSRRGSLPRGESLSRGERKTHTVNRMTNRCL